MLINREVISEIINDVRALGVDDRISERYVLSKLRTQLGLFLKREGDQLRLPYYDHIWTTIPCLEMETVDVQECLGITNSKITSVTRSKLSLPEIYSYKNGPIIKEVMSIDEGNVYQPSSPIDFNKIIKRDFVGNLRYYWFRNGHLLIPNGPDVVHFTACFVQQSAATALCSCNPTACVDIMEDEFPCPAHLLSTVKQETIKDIFSFYKRNVLDEVNDSDTNTKTEKPR